MGPTAPCSTGLDTAGVSSNSLLLRRARGGVVLLLFDAVETRLGVAARVLCEGLTTAKTTQSDGGQQLRVGLKEETFLMVILFAKRLCVPVGSSQASVQFRR